jgi:hypothetical protein
MCPQCAHPTVGAQAIYGGSSRGKLVSQYDTAIRINDKKPTYYHEIKVQLPSQLGPQHHLFFIFYSVGVKPKTQTEVRIPCTRYQPHNVKCRLALTQLLHSPFVVHQTVCAYAYLPLLDDDGKYACEPSSQLSVLRNR